MVKKYIFITNTIYDIGGGQLYINNKSHYLSKLGWEVFVFSSEKGNLIMVDGLSKFRGGIIEDLRYPPFYYTKKRINRVLNVVKNIVCKNHYNNGEVIVESNFIKTAYWGEMLAKQLNAINYIYLLQETFDKMHFGAYTFFKFKQNRRELVGIKKETIKILFEDFEPISDQYCYNLPAKAFISTVSNYKFDPLDRLTKSDITLCCISRLNKKFVRNMIDEVLIFGENHKNLKIQFILIGGSTEHDLEQAFTRLFSQSHIDLVLLGRVFPIPMLLFERVDIFIGVAGAAKITAREKKITLVYNISDNIIVGVLGIDTVDPLFGTPKELLPLSSWLHKILIVDKLHRDQFFLKKIHLPLEVLDYQDHLEFIIKNFNKKSYDFSFQKNMSIKHTVFKLGFLFFGMDRFESIYKRVRKQFLKYELLIRF